MKSKCRSIVGSMGIEKYIEFRKLFERVERSGFPLEI